MQDKLNKNEYFEHIANTKIALDLIQKDINTRNNIPEFCQLLDQKASNNTPPVAPSLNYNIIRRRRSKFNVCWILKINVVQNKYLRA